MDKQWRGIGWAAGLAAVWLALSAQYTLNEGQKALVVRLGAPVNVDGEPGLKFKLPLVDSVQYYDTRLQILAPPPEQVILGDEKRLEVETYTRYRIADTLRFYQALRTEEQARAQLTQLVSTSLRRELGKAPLTDLLSPGRRAIVARIQQEVAERARPLGLEVTEVQLHRADLPLETSQAIYDRMKSARQQEAKELRAQGAEWAQQIQAKAERDRTVILSEAQRQSAIIHGEADADAGRTLAQAFSKDPKFYKFYRSLQTYRQSLADSAPTLVLSPDSALLHDLKTGPAGGKP
ncbi:protease modulator HflC [Chromobacterium vaccinii]|uniref:Protein HflC n=1 Tax=Chromobacterium vaccinii TaxID=1108595 RepID=A0ABV0FEY6_9NEIS|nr:protease modulator HflC [Chromobacterium vaccinii]MCD4499999.1 protease modulator HflC [Chromobacterium vaccinii]